MKQIRNVLAIFTLATIAVVLAGLAAYAFEAKLNCNGALNLTTEANCPITITDFPMETQARVLLFADPDWTQSQPNAPLIQFDSILYPDGKSERFVPVKLTKHTQTISGTYTTEIVIVRLSFAGGTQTEEIRLPLTVTVLEAEVPVTPPPTAGTAPSIRDISIAGKTLFADQPYAWSFGFEDADGDVVEVLFQSRNSPDSSIWIDAGSLDPHVQNQKQGTIRVTTICNEQGQVYRQVILVDSAGNASAPVSYSFTCEVVRARINVAGNSTIRTREGSDLKAAAGMALRDGDTLTVSDNSTLELQNGAILDIGSRITRVPAVTSTLKFGTSTGSRNVLEVLSGVIYYYQLQTTQTGQKNIQIKTPYLVSDSSGTSLFVTHNPGEQVSAVGVVEGTLRVTSVFAASPTLTLSAGQQVAVSPKGMSPVSPIGSATPPPAVPPGGTGSLKAYDRNGNNRIDDIEFFNIADGWIAGNIENEFFFAAVDYWVAQQPLAAVAGIIPEAIGDTQLVVSAQATSSSVAFSVSNVSVKSLRVEIFNSMGKRIFHQTSVSSRALWKLQDNQLRPAANGVYFYLVVAELHDGSHARSELKKLVVLR